MLLILARLAMPHYVKEYVNRVLNRNAGYQGSVAEIDLHLWRGAYQIRDLKIAKRSGRVPIPLFSSPLIDLSVEWKSLWDGALVGEIRVERPKLNFVGGNSDAEKQDGTEGDWLRTIRDLFPLRINRFEVQDGEVHYRDFSTSPQIDVALTQVKGVVRNLTNSEKISKSRVAHLQATALAEQKTPAEMKMDIDPFSNEPNFYLNGTLKSLPVVLVNDLLKGYAGVNADAGNVSLYTELRTEKRRFDGYLKLLITDLSLLDWRKDTRKPFRFIWESLVATVAEIFTNQSEGQIATEIPLSGELDSPEFGTWSAVIGLFKNAFIEALQPGIKKSLKY